MRSRIFLYNVASGITPVNFGDLYESISVGGRSVAAPLSMTAAAQVQTPQTVSVAGIVTNVVNNEPILNVTLTFSPRAQAGGAQRLTATSDKDGIFSLPAVVPGLYSIQAQRVGFVVPRRFGLIAEVQFLPASRGVAELRDSLEIRTSA